MNATIFIVIPILTLLMFELGLNLRLNDFKLFRDRPLPVLAGLIGQIIILPALAWLIGWALHLEPIFLIGFVLIACCPGGSSSNVFSMLARGALGVAHGVQQHYHPVHRATNHGVGDCLRWQPG